MYNNWITLIAARTKSIKKCELAFTCMTVKIMHVNQLN